MQSDSREILSDEWLTGTTDGKLTVRSAATLRLEGDHSGPISLEGGGNLHVLGTLTGALDVGSLSTATISGNVTGPVEVRVAGTLIVESGGSLTGAVTNFGSFTNSGTRSGSVQGRQPDDREGSTTVPAGERTRD
jgi:hypothetical protein